MFMSESERSFICRDKAFVDSDDHCLCDLNEVEKKNKLLEHFGDGEVDSGDVILGSCEDCGLQLPPFSKVIFEQMTKRLWEKWEPGLSREPDLLLVQVMNVRHGIQNVNKPVQYEQWPKKTCLRGVWTRSNSNHLYRWWLEAWNFGFKKQRDRTINEAKTKVLVSWGFVFPLCWSRFSHDTAHILQLYGCKTNHIQMKN